MNIKKIKRLGKSWASSTCLYTCGASALPPEPPTCLLGYLSSSPYVQVAEYYPDLLSNYSNSSGTISYDTIITPRKAEYRELRYAAEGTTPREQCYYLRELELLPPPIIPEIVDWDLVKRINKLLVSKEKAKKTVEVQRAEKGTVEQSKKVCPTEWIRTPTTPLVTMEALEKAFNNDPYYISEADLVQEQTELFKKRVQKRQQRSAARAHMRPTFPKDPPAPESRSYGPAAMDTDSLVASDPKSDEDT
ncbi:unnamed protein product [Heligmosomoides polygyrus]|uniref:Uncharacterized protein n=1 Tax=Heligmosomoides polygyrus TaxID=6339 RepID=A0A183FQE4_HELPZ|nr:unnamed protein product [Heligmosomoides polygyrus]